MITLGGFRSRFGNVYQNETDGSHWMVFRSKIPKTHIRLTYVTGLKGMEHLFRRYVKKTKKIKLRELEVEYILNHYLTKAVPTVKANS